MSVDRIVAERLAKLNECGANIIKNPIRADMKVLAINLMKDIVEKHGISVNLVALQKVIGNHFKKSNFTYEENDLKNLLKNIYDSGLILRTTRDEGVTAAAKNILNFIDRQFEEQLKATMIIEHFEAQETNISKVKAGLVQATSELEEAEKYLFQFKTENADFKKELDKLLQDSKKLGVDFKELASNVKKLSFDSEKLVERLEAHIVRGHTNQHPESQYPQLGLHKPIHPSTPPPTASSPVDPNKKKPRSFEPRG